MKNTFSGSTKITDAGIKAHFETTDAEKAIFELVWNGLDAKATHVSIKIEHNDMDGLESVTVLDNGDGIDFQKIDDNFGKFNESLKKVDNNQHGSYGRGRLAFHKLSNKASWYTKHNNENALITVDSTISIKNFKGVYIESKDQHELLSNYEKGTCVELSGFTANRNLPTDSELLRMLNIEFGWYLALNSSQSITLNEKEVTVPKHELYESSLEIDGEKFDIKIFRWNDRPTSEKSYNYLVNSDNKVVEKELSSFNKKSNFYITAYAFSKWADSYSTANENDVFQKKPRDTKEYKELSGNLLDLQRNIYNEFLRKYVDAEIQKYDEKGFFPDYLGVDKAYAEWRKNNTKKVLKEVYLADPSVFNSLNAKQATLLIRLLDRILISNENDGFIEVLEGVLTLDSEKSADLAKQLKRTSFDNLVSTIEILHKREYAIQQLREVMNNHFKEVLETPDLQKIIEANTWLFGSQYATLGAEEDSFQTIAKNLRDTVKDVNLIDDNDIAEGNNIEGVNRQVDLFLARKVPCFDSRGDSFYKCVIIEIKRPSISLNKKHLRQLEDYAEIITKHPSFSDKMRFELILVGRKVSGSDTQIKSKLNGLKEKGELGLVGHDQRIKSYIKTWATIFDEFKLSNDYLLGTLNTKLKSLSNETATSLVSDLQKGSK